jgi:rSAM/selenodomain-associated transferase 1
MAKAPRAGAVKRRLSPYLTEDGAAALAHAFLCDAIDQVREVALADPAIAYAPADSRALFASLAPGFRLVAQRGADLGSRMLAALSDLRGAGVILVGSDIPTLDPAVLDRAVRLVSDPLTDLVIGPSEDGGYYLIAMRATHDVFSGIEMSTDAVLEETLARAARANLRVHLLPPTFDIDEAADLARLRDLLRQEEWRRRLPHTTAVLFPPPLPQATGEG